MTLEPVLEHLLAAPPEPIPAGDDPALWYRTFAEQVLVRGGGGPPGERETGDAAERWSRFGDALQGGFVADRPAWAMVAGHQAALRRLVGATGAAELMPAGGIVAFCASEEGGAHPRAIRSTLREDGEGPDGGFRLDGQKRWATLAPSSSALMVIASVGSDGPRNRLRAVCVPSDRTGVRIEPMDATGRPVTHPEVRHAVIDLESVPVAAHEVLGGDGYIDAVKPFRTVEDLYISAAMTAYNLAIGRRSGWPESALEDLLLLLASAGALASGPLDTPVAHLGLAAFERTTARVRAEQEEYWRLAPEPEALAWRRAVSGPGVALRARELRRQAAWARLSGVR